MNCNVATFMRWVLAALKRVEELPDDAMCNARQQFLGSQFQNGLLFDMTPAAEVPNTAELKRALIEIV